MKLSKKGKIIILITIILLINVISLIILNKPTTIDNIKIYDYSITLDEKVSKYTFKIKNTDKDRNIKYIKITINTKKKEDIILYAYVGKINKNETKELIATYDDEIKDIKDVKYEIINNKNE